MNATDLQTRIKNITYSLIVLSKSFPPGNTDSRLIRTLTDFANQKCGYSTGKVAASGISSAFGEMGATLYWIGSLADLHLIEPAKFSSVVREADGLASVLAAHGNSRERNRNVNN